MKRILLAWIAVGAVLAAPARAESPLRLSVSPEVWYVKWQPDVKPKENNEGLSYTSYDVSPSILYGLTLTAEYKDFGVAGSYLMSQSGREVGHRAGMGKAVSIESEIRGLIQCRLGDGWHMRNRILKGKFTGEATGVEWERSVGGAGTIKALPVNTDWFQGEMLFISDSADWQKGLQKVTGAGLVVGYRFQQYSIPVQVQTIAPNGDNYGIPGLARVSLLDTRFSIHHLVLGLESLPDRRIGWNLDVQRLLVGMGVTYAKNSLMNASSWDSKDDNGDSGRGLGSVSFEADIGVAYLSPVMRFELGGRLRTAQNYAGKGFIGLSNGDRIRMEDSYWGPYTAISIRFGNLESK